MIDPDLITTVRVGELPTGSLGLSSKIPHEIGTDLFRATIQDLVTFLQPYIGTFQYEVKQLDVTTSYITNNFDSSGLGTNIMVGWAICNGANGTHNMDGRVLLPYGTSNNVMAQLGGSRNAVIVSHSHPNSKFNPDNGTGTVYNFDAVGDREHYGLMSTDTVGESGTDKNMQPYIVQLFIMKL